MSVVVGICYHVENLGLGLFLGIWRHKTVKIDSFML